jgi:hypothetical protein
MDRLLYPPELACDGKRRSAGEAAMKAKTESDTALPAVIGIDIGKEVFHLVGLGTDGRMTFRRKIRRLGLKDAFERLPPCIVGMEACLSAHFVSRTLHALGHEPPVSTPIIGNRSYVAAAASIPP